MPDRQDKKIRLLLVEDDRVDQMAFEKYVKNMTLPYDYTIAGSVAEARTILKSNTFDIIISDYMLGDGISFELFDLFKKLPVIITTGTGNEEVAVEAMKRGACDYLIKDPEGNYLKTLPTTVELVLKRKRNEDELQKYQNSLESMVKERTGELQAEIAVRKKAEDALRVSHERFLTVLDSIDANIYVADMESYKILFMNKNLMNTFGRDLTGELCWEGFKGESEPCKHCTNDQLIDENGKPTGLCTWQNKNPITGKWYINNDRAIEWSDGRLVRIEIATDITDLKHMEEELRQAQKRESIGTLTGGIAHDFNNIMGIILGNTELALEDVPESNRAYSNLEAIKTASRRAANIVKQLSNLSRITDQKLQPIEIAPVIKDVLKFLRSTIPNTIDIQQDIQITNETILADPTQIKQIMMNLCINASHAMEQTGGKLTTTVENVFLDDSSAKDYPDLKSGKYVKVVVSDTGPGIDPKIINRIFDPYFTTKGIGKGSGMGLAVVHGIVKSHSGAITIDSTLGKGTKFIMFFPLVTEKPIVEVQTT